MSAGFWLGMFIGSPLWIYLVARLIAAAYFLSKQQYEKRKHHE